MKGLPLIAVSTFCAAMSVTTVQAQQTDSKKVTFTTPQSKYLDKITSVSGTLNIPSGKTGKLPAVLILHASGGVDGTGAKYVEVLNKAGIATFEIEMFGPGQTLESHPTGQQNFPHVFGGLQFLMTQPQIDPRRVGVMGFSWGGMLAILAASDRIAAEFQQDLPKFRAHLALYPMCWLHSSVLNGTAEGSPHKFLRIDKGTYARFTGAPVHILAGEKDQYDDPDSCGKFVVEANGSPGAVFSQTTYPGAYHGWDKTKEVRSPSPLAYKGKGGWWLGFPDHRVTEQSRQFATDFFTKHLGVQ